LPKGQTFSQVDSAEPRHTSQKFWSLGWTIPILYEHSWTSYINTLMGPVERDYLLDQVH